jgi:hypothetical protein
LLPSSIKILIADNLLEGLSDQLDAGEIQWEIIKVRKEQPRAKRVHPRTLHCIRPALENIDSDEKTHVIVHPEYNGILDSGSKVQQLLGPALFGSLLYAIIDDFCEKWEQRRAYAEGNAEGIPVWRTALYFMLHSYTLGYIQGKMGSTVVTRRSVWRDGVIGERSGSDKGLFNLHEKVMSNLTSDMKTEIDEREDQYQYDPVNNKHLFIRVTRKLILNTEEKIDEMMNDQNIMAKHTRRGKRPTDPPGKKTKTD